MKPSGDQDSTPWGRMAEEASEEVIIIIVTINIFFIIVIIVLIIIITRMTFCCIVVTRYDCYDFYVRVVTTKITSKYMKVEEHEHVEGEEPVEEEEE